MLGLNLDSLTRTVEGCDLYRTAGKLRSATGLLTCALPAAVGDHCEIQLPASAGGPILAEVIGFANDLAYLVPYDPADSVRPGMTVVRRGHGLNVPVGRGLLGRVLDGLGRPVDGAGPLTGYS
jgi:flagellar biosynthesis/type III secretory pathway ATPase